MRHTTWRFKMSGSSEEEIIRKRLTVEGESGQDDRRITSLLKTFLKWCDLASLSEEDSQATYQKMLFTLGQVEFSFLRTELVDAMNKDENSRYDQLVSSIDKDITDSKKLIESQRGELEKARLVRQHLQEYDAMATVIQRTPTRSESAIKIKQLERELEDLTNKQSQLTEQLSLRRKQGYLLSFAIHQLLDTLDRPSTNNVNNNNDNSSPMEH